MQYLFFLSIFPKDLCLLHLEMLKGFRCQLMAMSVLVRVPPYCLQELIQEQGKLKQVR